MDNSEEKEKYCLAYLNSSRYELLTPLNGIHGCSCILRNSPDMSAGDRQQICEFLEERCFRMGSMIDDFFESTKIHFALLKPHLAEVKINKLLMRVCRNFEPDARKKGIKLAMKNPSPDGEDILETDGGLITEIFKHLIKNAIKYTIEGSVEIGYNHGKDHFEFFVTDTGIGIPAEWRGKIFTPYTQADNLSEKMAGRGSGLGLWFCKTYVDMLGGSIRVESEEDKGSVFLFTIPVNARREENPLP